MCSNEEQHLINFYAKKKKLLFEPNFNQVLSKIGGSKICNPKFKKFDSSFNSTVGITAKILGKYYKKM